ncbi:hypothetical protein KY290_000599 [Solanum tuberosum]|uniref:Uncharacterized protein n=1 Tax=Solanum tuberosum TaxID=4113 RepID=A0ABQ7WJT3_SOLTU|nr:hypothetical protein KY289_000663 [Solanum tuberosum]KAH0781001.1 hypothetical protein KY290_000599 [Solanum tuberosum]
MDNNFSSVKRLVADTVGEEMKEERAEMDTKNPQEAEMDKRNLEEAEIDMNFSFSRKHWFRGKLMKEMFERTLAEKMGEEAERTMVEMVGEEMKDEGTQVDTKNPQMAEVDIDFSSTEGTMGE